MYMTWHTYIFGDFCAMNDLQKLWDFAYKSKWLDTVYLGDHKYINIMLLWWLEG